MRIRTRIGLAAMALVGVFMAFGDNIVRADPPPSPLVLPIHFVAVPRGGGDSFTGWASAQDSSGTKDTVKGGTGKDFCGSCWRISLSEPEPGTVVAVFGTDNGNVTITQTGGSAWVWDDGLTVYDLSADGPVSTDQGVTNDFRAGDGDVAVSLAWEDGEATLVADENADGLQELQVGETIHLSVARTWSAGGHGVVRTYEGGWTIRALRRTEQPSDAWIGSVNGPGFARPVTIHGLSYL